MSDKGKGSMKGSGDFAGDDYKGTADEMSKMYKRCQNREEVVIPGQVGDAPVYCPDGIRHKGGVNCKEALIWNIGTCRADAKGKFKQLDL